MSSNPSKSVPALENLDVISLEDSIINYPTDAS